MFDFFKRWAAPEREPEKRNSFAAFLSFDDVSYSNAIRELFEQMDTGTRAHVVVAYVNLVQMLSAAWLHARQTGGTFTVEDFIREASASLDSYTDEINSRRRAWFLFAALLGRLEKLANGNSAIAEIGARIWCLLVSDFPKLKALLPNNIVWKESEKGWFDLSLSDDKMIQDGINHFIPPMFAQMEPVKELAKSQQPVPLALHHSGRNHSLKARTSCEQAPPV